MVKPFPFQHCQHLRSDLLLKRLGISLEIFQRHKLGNEVVRILTVHVTVIDPLKTHLPSSDSNASLTQRIKSFQRYLPFLWVEWSVFSKYLSATRKCRAVRLDGKVMWI